ncbi:MAG: Phosphoenolpyruvate synthase [Candidatus Woesebacteria bacterium GW2011_GWB1_43_14]|uniref:Phosphoenolpyruvate synthase n=1 Tax=Candidatus Woesebacteria bacterium GW2011_GWB1_43_14 TaxID=1618578 RepID=A0A0G1GE20_9BACT|nr:MAG: Phosphoenolpyruvate synthase [Candidatus Woesebacteria bacterium GW2011_GWA1_39_11b]KKS78481.1 MAG: Phosphoenolpyruvate synthase [Candidatus Woesebacteria bacterium GW2011_GWC1_42_9]KKS97103.1 MAG: Phosphoenolpyruvate synthase [Candidatus Woesebacteria bacterium GW2011_GWB1_43_14]
MPAEKPLILFYNEIDKSDIPSVGGKGANLGEMTKAGFPVPNGFAVTVQSYEIFLTENDLHEKIKELLGKTDRNDSEKLAKTAKLIQKLILRSKIPSDVAWETINAYKKLSGKFSKALVAVRSSATAEDLPTASFAGQQASFLNVKGDASLLESVKMCWASLFTARAIFYREENKIPHEKVKISVLIQKMIQSEVSGVIFTIDPVTNEKDRIVIEAVWGLGEMIVQGLVIPDRYVVQKDTYSILSKEISDQDKQLIRAGAVNKETKVPDNQRDIQKITDQDIVHLAKLAQDIHNHYYFPQDIEWHKEKGKLYVVQTRPVTTIGTAKIKPAKDKDIKTSITPILSGQPASPGMGSGHVRILKSPNEISKVGTGDILVAEMTSPDYVPAMKKAVAIITNEGGMTSHAAIVSRELGIPCVVGTKKATTMLSEGMVVTVDGEKGQIFMGSKVKIIEKKEEKKEEKIVKTKTATKIYVNLAEPERAREISKKYVDGVGLLRAEFMIANIGIHPKEAIKMKKQEKFISKLASDISIFCKNFDPRPVIYRTTDFKTNEYRSLSGGKHWEPEEPNPMLGFRGAFRYVANPDVFNLELQAIKRVREKYKNLQVMIPFVRSPEELVRIRRIMATEGLFESPSFKFLMMVELPVNVIKLEDFIRVGIDGVSIGSNDLTMLLLGTDRDNSEVASAFNENSPVVRWALKRIIRICNKHNVTSSICGQAPSVYDELVEKLVSYGITSISVNPDAINRVRRVVAECERKILK